MVQFFPSSFFAGNRRAVLANSKVDLIVIGASALVQKSADIPHKFRQDSYFWYLTGIEIPEAILVMNPSSGKEYLILPDQTDYTKAFAGEHEIENLHKISGIEEIYDYQEGWKILSKNLRVSTLVGVCEAHPEYIDIYQMYANPARESLLRALRKINSVLSYQDLRTIIARLRMVKQPFEIEALQKAIDITVLTFEGLPKEDFAHEYEIEAYLGYGFRGRGADGHGYEPIVASGNNACILHYEANQRRMVHGDGVMIDAGAAYAGYSADISRTFVHGGEPSKRLVEVHRAVQEVQKACITLLKPGIYMRDFLKEADTLLGEQLIALGLIKENTRDNVREYYPHSTSHFLGIDVHDAGDYDLPLQENTVLTVEPGIYIPNEQVGVRIEDDVIVTKTGTKILSSALSTDLLIIP